MPQVPKPQVTRASFSHGLHVGPTRQLSFALQHNKAVFTCLPILQLDACPCIATQEASLLLRQTYASAHAVSPVCCQKCHIPGMHRSVCTSPCYLCSGSWRLHCTHYRLNGKREDPNFAVSGLACIIIWLTSSCGNLPRWSISKEFQIFMLNRLETLYPDTVSY